MFWIVNLVLYYYVGVVRIVNLVIYINLLDYGFVGVYVSLQADITKGLGQCHWESLTCDVLLTPGEAL